MFQLSQLYLQFALVALRTLGKNIENQAGPVNDAPFQQPFQIALLRRAEIMVENGHRGFGCLHGGGQFFRLATAKKKLGIRLGTPTLHRRLHLQTGTGGKLIQLLQAFLLIRLAKIEARQNRHRPGIGTVKHGS